MTKTHLRRGATGALIASLAIGAVTVTLAAPASATLGGTLPAAQSAATLSGTLVVVEDHNVGAEDTLFAIQTADGTIVPVDAGALETKFEAAEPGDDVVAAVTDPAAGQDPVVVSASVTPQVAQVSGSAVPFNIYLVAVDDPVESGDVTLSQATTSTNESLAFWARDGRGVFDNGNITASRTWTRSGSCALDYWGLWNEADDLFPGVNFGAGSGNHLVVFSPSTCSKPYAGIATVGSAPITGGTVQIVGNLPSALTHELGHNFSLGHSDLEYTNASNALVIGDYYGTFGPQGPVIANEKPSSLDVAYQQQLGVPGVASAITTASANTELDLTASNSTSGTRALKFTEPGTNATWFVEYRPGTGSDVPSFYTGPYVNGGLVLGGLPIWYSPGVRIYRWDGYDVTTVSRRQASTVRATFQNGEVYTSPTSSFTIESSALNGTTAHVKLTFAGGGGGSQPPSGPAATATTAQVNAKPYGDTTTITATTTAPAGVTLTGGYELWENGALMGSGAGGGSPFKVSFGLTAWNAGSHTVEVRYLGDANSIPSTATLTFTIPKAPSTTTMTTTGASSSTPGTATVTVTPTAPAMPTLKATGTVEVYNGSTLLGSGTLSNGTVTVTLAQTLNGGAYTLTAKYLGTANINASQGSASYSVAGSDTTTTATTTNTQYGSPAKVNVTVASASGTPTGTVQVFNGTTQLASGTLSAGQAQVSLPATLATGSYTLTVKYVATTAFAASSTTVPLTVSAAPSNLTTTGASWKYGLPAAVKIALTSPTGGTPTGVVSIYNGATKLADVTLVGGTATFMPPANLPVGSYTLDVVYAGNGTVAPMSGTVGVVVNPATSAVSASIKSSLYGTAAIEVRVDVDTRIMANSGDAQIWFGSTLIASAPVVNGVALVNLPANTPLGIYSWKAVYTGSSDINTGTYTSGIALRIR